MARKEATLFFTDNTVGSLTITMVFEAQPQDTKVKSEENLHKWDAARLLALTALLPRDFFFDFFFLKPQNKSSPLLKIVAGTFLGSR